MAGQKLFGKDADDWYNEGIGFYKEEKYGEAITCFNKAIKLNPNDADAWAGKGGALTESGLHKEAIECYDKALSINPKHTNAFHNKGISLTALRQYGGAKKCFENMLRFAREQQDKEAINSASEELKKLARLPNEIVVPTKAGFKYIFNLKLKKIFIVFEKAALSGVFGGKRHYSKDITERKAAIRNMAKCFGSIGLAAGGMAPAVHEGIHIGVDIALGGKFEGITIEMPLTPTVHFDAMYMPLESVLIGTLAPHLFEAFLGLYLIKLGLKEKKPIYFGYGVVSFIGPIAGLIGSAFQQTDFSTAAGDLKQILINNFGSNTQFAAQISAINEIPIIFLLAAAIYGTAIFGVKYIPKINEELITARQTRKLLHEIKKKDYFLYEALGRKFLWPANSLREKVLKKIMGNEKYGELQKKPKPK